MLERKKIKKSKRYVYPEYRKRYYNKHKKESLSYMKTYRETNKEKIQKLRKKYRKTHPENILSSRLKHAYGIDLEKYNSLLLTQKSKCALCPTKNTKSKRLRVDHCHKTNKIRGLLCDNCNLMLGHAKDNLDILMNGIAYLKKAVG